MGIHGQADTAFQRDESVATQSAARAVLVRPIGLTGYLLSQATAFFIAAMALSGPAGLGPAMALPGLTEGNPELALPIRDVPGIGKHAAQTKLPKGVNADWWRRVQRGLAAAEYDPSRNSKGLQAPNRAHNLRTYFSPDGIHLRDRMLDRPLVGLSLSGMGRGADLALVAAGEVTQSGKRVEIRRPGIVEWYENTAKGLEQGFTLERRVDGEGALVLDLAVEHARARLRGDFIEMKTESGRRLRYGKLVVVDANGATLASRMETPSPERLRLVVDDTDAAYPVVIDPLLTAEPDAIMDSNRIGADFFDPPAFGASVASAGDVNGDGFDDVVVGAWGWDGGSSVEGAAFVFLGSLNGIVGENPDTAHAHIESDQAFARLGWSVAGAGDVNNDGADDIVIGAYLFDSIRFFNETNRDTGEPWGDLQVRGAVFVFHGSDTGGITASSPLDADATITSNELESFLGYSVASAGDVNNDGFGDIIMGGPLSGISFQDIPGVPPDNNIPPNDRSGNTGVALVFHGGPSGITGTGYDDADKVLTPYPPNAPDNNVGSMGGDVAGAGDVNGDGFSDVIVTNASSAVVFLGSQGGVQGNYPGDAHAVITTDVPASVTSVAGAGNVNGDRNNPNDDRFDDIIIGAKFYPIQNSTTEEGAAFVFHGSAAGLPTTDTSTANAKFFGNILAEWVGSDVAGVGDIDSDGYDDIAIAARVFPGSLDSEGVAHIFRGGPGGIDDTNGLSGSYARLGSGQSRASINLNDYAISVAGAGDVNGDGFADVIFGTGFYDLGEVDEGAAFVYHGAPAPDTLNQPPAPNAGPDGLFVDVDNNGVQTVRADGTASTDSDGSIASYRWTEGETLLGTLPTLKTALPWTGDHTVVLTVTDDNGVSRGDPVTLRVEPVPDSQVLNDGFDAGLGNWTTTGDVVAGSFNSPFPEAPQARIRGASTLSRTIGFPAGATGITLSFWGQARSFVQGEQVALQVSVDGGASFTTLRTFTAADNADNMIFYGGSAERIGFSWYPATSSSAVLRFASSTAAGDFLIDSIVARALFVPPGTPVPVAGKLPVPDAGADVTVDDGGTGSATVELNGSGSFHPDGLSLSYQWYDVTKHGPVLLGNQPVLDVAFPPGDNVAQLLVTDGAGGSMGDTVAITVNRTFPGNLPPIARAGSDRTVFDTDGNTLEVVTFDGSASMDPDGSIVSYQWTKNGNPFGNTATFSVTQPIGVHTVQLTVTDNLGATSTDTVTITVAAPDNTEPNVDTVGAAPATITAGEASTLSWTTSNADSVSISGVGTGLPADGNVSVSPAETTTYTLTATGTGGTATSTVTVTVNPASPVAPNVDSFGATPDTIAAGGSATLNWTTTGADSVSIDNGVGSGLPADGSISVSPTATTTYTLTATGAGGSATSTMTVTVNQASSEILTITELRYRNRRDEWRISGTSSLPGPGNTLTIYNGPVAPGPEVIGTTSVGSTGTWSFRDRNSPVQPHNTGTISIMSSQGGKWEGISGTGVADPSGDPPPPPVPTVDSFTASSATITAGGSATLTWATTDATGVSINGGPALNADGSTVVSPTATTTYVLTATGAGGSATASVTVTVDDAPPPPPPAPTVDSFTASSATITAGSSATLTWATTDATGVSINGGQPLNADGSTVVSPAATTTYVLTATGAGGSATASVTVTVDAAPPPPPPAPTVDSFTASSATITAGGSVTLNWATTDAVSVAINGGASLAPDGSLVVSPTATTTYTLVATGAGNDIETASVTVTVTAGSPPQGAVTINGPSSVDRGNDISFTVTLTNTGTSTLTGVALSFDVSPGDRVKDISPGGTVTVGDVAPGASVSRTWSGEADKEGSATVSAEAFNGGESIAAASRSLTVIK